MSGFFSFFLFFNQRKISNLSLYFSRLWLGEFRIFTRTTHGDFTSGLWIVTHWAYDMSGRHMRLFVILLLGPLFSFNKLCIILPHSQNHLSSFMLFSCYLWGRINSKAFLPLLRWDGGRFLWSEGEEGGEVPGETTAISPCQGRSWVEGERWGSCLLWPNLAKCHGVWGVQGG